MHGPTESANLAMALKWAGLYANGAPGDWVMEATTEDVTWQEPPWRFYPQGRVIEGRAQLLEGVQSFRRPALELFDNRTGNRETELKLGVGA